jgi:hypothetical protein
MLRYYELKQAPNFALAAPMLMLCVCAVYSYVAADVHRVLTLGLGRHLAETEESEAEESEVEAEAEAEGFSGERVEDLSACEWESHGYLRRSARLRHRNVPQSMDELSPPRRAHAEVARRCAAAGAEPRRTGFHGDAVLPFIVHCAFMLLVAALVMHVQVRRERSNPSILWCKSQPRRLQFVSGLC